MGRLLRILAAGVLMLALAARAQVLPVPDGIPPALRRKILVENPVATYDRLKGLSSEEDVR